MLCVAHMAGNAGVMTGMRCRASPLETWTSELEPTTTGQSTYRRIPHAKTILSELVVLQHDRPWPIPLVHEVEELGKNCSAASHGIELADAGDHDSPRDSSGVTEDCAVDGATWLKF